ncbi:Fic family protein [Taibaiella soli]|uniref:Fic family protein n=1 Tax=Taibaiella soli TaxID=1649169 RepID=A0A2W2BB99_9BACT|nr:Fic family protein [Taibaiella soli]PZF70916.1 Fic family protein [Taibaiella soli]
MNVSLLETIDRKRKELEALLPMSPENEDRFNKKISLEFNYNSNHIEGNTLTYGETKLLLLFGEVSGKHSYRDLAEMKASEAALKQTRELALDKERTLTESTIRDLNEILLVEPFWKEAKTAEGQPTRVRIIPGEYKRQPNGVTLENGGEIPFASPQETPMLMSDLVTWFRDEEEKGELPAVVLAAAFHHRFVRIHPFADGNGRVSRLLMNYVFYKNDLPPVVIKSVDKANYLRALRAADSGNLDTFLDYIAEQLIWSLDLAIRSAKGEEIEEADDWKKQLKVLKAELDHKEEITEKISVPAINSIINDVARPLKKMLEGNLEEIAALFLKSSFDISIPDRQFNQSEAAYLILNSNKTLLIQLSFMTFKKNGFDPFDVFQAVFFIFSEYDYIIKTFRLGGNEVIFTRKGYHQKLTESEQTDIVNRMAGDIMNQIQQKLKHS